MYPFSVKFVMKSLKVSCIWIFTSFGSIIGAIAEESKRELEIDTGLQKLDQDLQQNWDCSGPSKEAAVRETTKSQITVNVGENKKTNQKGSVKRKSYTLDFKLKTLGLLDKLTEAGVKDKWRKVAAMKGISNRSLVIKWNKDR